MAYLELKNGKKQSLSKEQGLALYNAMQLPLDTLDDLTAERITSVKRLYLNWHSAPDSYIKANLEAIIPIALHDWRVNLVGEPIKPQSAEAWAFAKRWGLWEFGRPSALVAGGQVEIDY